MLSKIEDKLYYHLFCNYCGEDWIMDKTFPKYCPFCGCPSSGEKNNLNCAFGQTLISDENIFSCKKKKKCSSCDSWEPRDCTTCNHGHYNDRYNTYFWRM